MIPRRRQSSRDYRPSTNRPSAELAENSCAASDESVRDLAFERALSAILFSALRAPVGVEIHVDLSRNHVSDSVHSCLFGPGGREGRMLIGYPNFGRSVLGCIKADFWSYRLILQFSLKT